MSVSLFKHILVVQTGSEASIHAIKYAVLMSLQYKCKITVIYVVDTAAIKQLTLSKIFVKEESIEYEENLTATGKRYLSYAKELGAEKGVSIDTELRFGAVWSEVVTAAAEKKSDLILLGGDDAENRESRDMLAHTFNAIITQATCSILLVKEPMVEHLYKTALK